MPIRRDPFCFLRSVLGFAALSTLVVLAMLSGMSIAQTLRQESFYTDIKTGDALGTRSLAPQAIDRLESKSADRAHESNSALSIRNEGNVRIITNPLSASSSQWPATIFGIVLSAFVFYGLKQFVLARSLIGSLSMLASRLKTIDVAVLIGLIAFAYARQGIMDTGVFGDVGEATLAGINVYAVSTLQGSAGNLPMFPYNPPCLFFLAMAGHAQASLQYLGIPSHSFSLLNVGLVGALYALAFFTARTLNSFRSVNWSHRALFYFALFNPLAFYYAMFLGQLDIIAVSLLVAGIYYMAVEERKTLAWALVGASACLLKPQHALFIPLLFLAGVCFSGNRILPRHYWFALSITAGAVAAIYCLYLLYPYFAASLTANPQVARISWSSWWSLLGDAIVINRPVAYITILSIFFVALTPAVSSTKQFAVWTVFAVGSFYGSFQASFAHTFGLTAYMIPAAISAAAILTSKTQAWTLSIMSIAMLAAWGTGFCGDATNVVGLHLPPQLADIHFSIKGISYVSLMNSIEYAAILAFALIFAIQASRVRALWR